MNATPRYKCYNRPYNRGDGTHYDCTTCDDRLPMSNFVQLIPKHLNSSIKRVNITGEAVNFLTQNTNGPLHVHYRLQGPAMIGGRSQ